MKIVRLFKDCPQKDLDCRKCSNYARCSDLRNQLIARKQKELKQAEKQARKQQKKAESAERWKRFWNDVIIITATLVALAIFAVVMYFFLEDALGSITEGQSRQEAETRDSAEIIAEENEKLDRILAKQANSETAETSEETKTDKSDDTHENNGMQITDDSEASTNTMARVAQETEAKVVIEVKKMLSQPATRAAVKSEEVIVSSAHITTEVSKPNAVYGHEFSEDEILLIAKVIYAEAVGEEYIGKVAIGAIILNRFFEGDDYSFSRDSIWSIVTQPDQMAMADVSVQELEDTQCLKAAKEATSGVDPTQGALFPKGALFWFNPDEVSGIQALLRTDIDTLQFGKHLVHTELNWEALKNGNGK